MSLLIIVSKKLLPRKQFPGDEAIIIARGMKGQPTTQIFKVSYISIVELIKKLEETTKRTKRGYSGIPPMRLIFIIIKGVGLFLF
jgi:hypothetical protein